MMFPEVTWSQNPLFAHSINIQMKMFLIKCLPGNSLGEFPQLSRQLVLTRGSLGGLEGVGAGGSLGAPSPAWVPGRHSWSAGPEQVPSPYWLLAAGAA